MHQGPQEEAELAAHFVPQEQLEYFVCCLPWLHLGKIKVELMEMGTDYDTPGKVDDSLQQEIVTLEEQ